MGKKTKLTIVASLILLVLATSIAMLMIWQTWHYTSSDMQFSLKDFPLSKWVSTDGKVELYVGSDGKCYGFINSEVGPYHVYWTMNAHRMLCHDIKYCVEDGKTPPTIENWELTFKKNRFIAEVYVKDGVFYDKYDTIVFNLVEENLNESDIPYPTNLSESPQTE